MNNTQDDSTTLTHLKGQLEFIEKGGYAEPTRTPWRPPTMFLDSPTCLNFGASHRTRPCDECVLMRFVPEVRWRARIPCHHIPLTKAGDTVESAEGWADQSDLEDLVKTWLRRTIEQLEDALCSSRSEASHVDRQT
jgi:hypothetical protein